MSNPWDNKTDVTRLPVGYNRDVIPIADADFSDVVDNVGVDSRSGDANVGVGFYTEVAGVVSFMNVDGNTRTVNVVANSHFMCSVRRIMETGTDTGLNVHVLIA